MDKLKNGFRYRAWIQKLKSSVKELRRRISPFYYLQKLDLNLRCQLCLSPRSKPRVKSCFPIEILIKGGSFCRKGFYYQLKRWV